MNGRIENIESYFLTQHGHCWSTSNIPTVNDNKTEFGIVTNETNVISELSNLSVNTTYYYRTYTRSNSMIFYGSILSFSTSEEIINLAPIAEFNSDKKNILTGESIYFLDLSENNPSSWNWNSEGSYPLTSNIQNPTFTYNNIGFFDVELEVSNNIGSDTKLKTDYITVKESSFLLMD